MTTSLRLLFSSDLPLNEVVSDERELFVSILALLGSWETARRGNNRRTSESVGPHGIKNVTDDLHPLLNTITILQVSVVDTGNTLFSTLV